jgi:hypothetical protein
VKKMIVIAALIGDRTTLRITADHRSITALSPPINQSQPSPPITTLSPLYHHHGFLPLFAAFCPFFIKKMKKMSN